MPRQIALLTAQWADLANGDSTVSKSPAGVTTSMLIVHLPSPIMLPDGKKSWHDTT